MPTSKNLEIAGVTFQINSMTPAAASWVFHLFASTAMRFANGCIPQPYEMPTTAEERVQAAVDGLWMHCAPVQPKRLYKRIQRHALYFCRVYDAKGGLSRLPADLEETTVQTLTMEAVKLSIAPILLAAEMKAAPQR